jgi:phosphatidate cytidylyltransferase
VLKQRVLTGVIGGAIALGAVWYGGAPFDLLIAFLALVGFSELARMRGFGVFSLPACLGYLVTLAWVFGFVYLPLAEWVPARDMVPMFFLFVSLLLFLTVSVVTKNRYTFQDVAYLFAGTIYLGLPFHTAVLLRADESLGLPYFLLVLLSMWATDTFAYFVGRTLKGPKLWPAISPNKTVSGAVGGLLGGILVGAGFAALMDLAVLPWALLGAILSVVGQLGDFVESGLKRSLNVKDSGTILPGHGGILDRFDSFLFAAPVAYYGTLILIA